MSSALVPWSAWLRSVAAVALTASGMEEEGPWAAADEPRTRTDSSEPAASGHRNFTGPLMLGLLLRRRRRSAAGSFAAGSASTPGGTPPERGRSDRGGSRGADAPGRQAPAAACSGAATKAGHAVSPEAGHKPPGVAPPAARRSRGPPAAAAPLRTRTAPRSWLSAPRLRERAGDRERAPSAGEPRSSISPVQPARLYSLAHIQSE